MYIQKLKNKMQTIISRYVNKRFNRRAQRRLKNDRFTILCPNCIGGVIYNRLGKQFLSPTINMWMHQLDFLIFLENLDECLTNEIRFVESDCAYPVAELTCSDGVVMLHFNHAKSAEDAAKDWYRRRERVQRDNLYIIMYDLDGITREHLWRLDKIPCQNKVVLSDKKRDDIPFVKTIIPNPETTQTNFLDRDKYGVRTFEKQFDFVAFLNVKK